MARERMITRTVEQTKVRIMALNVNTVEVNFIETTIGGVYDTEALMKKLKKMYETEELKLVHIEQQETEEVLLGMTEEDFIKYAKVLPPRGTR